MIWEDREALEIRLFLLKLLHVIFVRFNLVSLILVEHANSRKWGPRFAFQPRALPLYNAT